MLALSVEVGVVVWEDGVAVGLEYLKNACELLTEFPVSVV